MGINFSTPIFLLDSRNIVKATIQFTWNNGTNLASSLTCCCSRGKEGDGEVINEITLTQLSHIVFIHRHKINRLWIFHFDSVKFAF